MFGKIIDVLIRRKRQRQPDEEKAEDDVPEKKPSKPDFIIIKIDEKIML